MTGADRARALVIVDDRVPSGELHIGGAVVLAGISDAELGWAALAKLVRVHSAAEADALEAKLAFDGIETRRLVDGRLPA